MSGWEQYFKKIYCEENFDEYTKDRYPYILGDLYTTSPVVYIYLYNNATELEKDLPMPPTDSFEYMFFDCHSLTNIDALNNWDTSNVKYMNGMFFRCYSLTNIDALKNWDIKNVENLSCMFYMCKSLLNIDRLRDWDTRNVNITGSMFFKCYSLSNIDGLKDWNTNNIKNTTYMFIRCISITNIDALKNWNIEKVKEMFAGENMFPITLEEWNLFKNEQYNN